MVRFFGFSNHSHLSALGREQKDIFAPNPAFQYNEPIRVNRTTTRGEVETMKFEQKVLLIGGVAGALIGVAAAYLYVKNNEEQVAAVKEGRSERMAKVSPREALGVGMSLVALIRQIVGLGQG